MLEGGDDRWLGVQRGEVHDRLAMILFQKGQVGRSCAHAAASLELLEQHYGEEAPELVEERYVGLAWCAGALGEKQEKRNAPFPRRAVRSSRRCSCSTRPTEWRTPKYQP